MKRLFFYIGAISTFFSCSSPSPDNKEKTKTLSYTVIEKKVYDIPAKSQVSYRVYLTDSLYNETQLRQLTNSLASECNAQAVSFHKAPTHVFVYVYKQEGDFEINGAGWVAMYEKTNNKVSGVQIKK